MTHERSIEEWLRAALDAAPESFALHRIIRDEAGAFQDLEVAYQSAAAARMSGLAAEALVGKRILELFPSHRGTPAWEGYRHVADTGETMQHEVSYVGEGIDGWFETTTVRVEGQYLAISGRDVTKRRRAEDALRILSEADAALNETLDPSETLQSLARVIVPQLGDRCVLDLVEDDHIQRVAFGEAGTPAVVERGATGMVPADGTTGIARVLRTGRAELVAVVTDAWLDETTTDPERRKLLRTLGLKSVLIVPITNLGQVVGAVSVCVTRATRRPYDEDDIRLVQGLADRAASAITRARLYEAALRTRRAGEDTLALVSHDLRGHLSGILRNAGSLARHGNAPEIDRIRRLVTRADARISALTTAARIEDAGRSLERRLQAVAPLLQEVAELHRTAAQDRHIELSWAAGDDLPLVSLDGRRIQQVLSNLVGNALEFTPDGGHVTVRARLEGEALQVAVSDDGAGISPEDQVHVFDHFWQAAHSRRAGAGLGLAVAKGIVEQHGGELRVESELGKGATFTFSIPAALDDEVESSVPPPPDVDAADPREPPLGDAQTFAESVVDTVRESLLVLDGELRVRSANRAFHATFGLTPEETLGRPLFELREGDWDVPALRSYLENLGADDAREEFRLEHTFRNVGWRVLLLNARRIERTQLVLLAMQDITERARAQQTLQRRELEFHAILTTAAEAIVMVDGAGKVVFANQKATQLFGFEPGELIGLSGDTLVPERMRQVNAQRRAVLAAAPETRAQEELVGRRKDGTEFPVEVSVSSMAREGGAQLVLAFVSDLTRRRESESKIRDYQDKLQRMTFDAAVAEEQERRRIAVDLHDRIGQSLALAQIKLMSIEDTCSGAPRAAINAAVELLEQSVADTRDLMFELSPPILYDLGLLAALSWLAEDLETRLGLRIELHEESAHEPLDDTTAAVVFRAVRELLMNVFKHARVREARVSLREAGDDLRITVEDLGVGFDAKDEVLWTTGGGFGLLSVREQIRRLGGAVEVTSAKGGGTRVSIHVPRQKEPRRSS